MAATLDEEVKKKKAASALLDSADEDDSDVSNQSGDGETDETASTDSETDSEQAAPQQNYVFRPVAAPAWQPSAGAIAEAQQQAAQYAAAPSTDVSIPAETSVSNQSKTPITFDTSTQQLVGTGQAAPEEPQWSPEAAAAQQAQQYRTPQTWSPEAAALQQAGQFAGGSAVLTPETAQDVGLRPDLGYTAPPEALESRPPEVRRAELVATPTELEAQQQADQYAATEAGVTPVRRAIGVFTTPSEQGVDVTPTAPAVRRGELVPQGNVPAVERAQPVPGQNYVFQPVDAQGKPVGQPQQPGQPVVARGLPAGAAPPIQEAQPVDTSTFINPDGTPLPGPVTAVDGSAPKAVILHHTSGRGGVEGVVSTLKERHLGVQYVVDRNGIAYLTGGPGAQNILPGWGPKGQGLNNSNIVGIEVIANDDKDVNDAQKQTVARLIAKNYPTTPLYGHGEVNPGHKEADEGQSTKAAALALRGQGGGAEPPVPQAQPTTKQANGFYQGEDPTSFVRGRATVFATDEDRRLYEATNGEQGDNGVGASKLGGLDTTQAIGLAIPHDALVAQLGNNSAAWRKARVDIVDPKTGTRMRVPIVDLGPGVGEDVVADMTPGLAKFFGGDNPNLAFKIVPNAGPDVQKDPQSFNDEQAALREGYDSSAARQVASAVARQNYTFKPIEPKTQATLDQANAFAIASQKQTLSDLNDQFQSPVALYKRLEEPVQGVSDAMRKEYQGQIQKEITAYAQDYYNEKDPAKAFGQATQDANFATVAGEAIRRIPAAYGQLDVALNQAAQSSDANALDRFARVIHPEATPEGRAAFIKTLTDIRDPNVRSQTIGKLWAELDPQKQAAIDINGLVQSADNVASPEYQKAQQTAIDTKKAWINKELRANPQLEGTLGQFIADQGAQFLPNVTMALLPPGVRESAFAAQIYSQAKDEFRQDHPDWSEAQLNDAAGKSTVLQLAPQEFVTAAIGGKLGALTGGIENRAVRIGATALAHTAVGAGGAVWQQIAANVAAGKDPYEGIPQAALAGVIQTLPGGIAAGLTHPFAGRQTKVEQPPPPTEQQPVPPPPVTEERPAPPPPPAEERPVPPPPPPIEERPVEEQPVAQRPEEEVEANLNKQNEAIDKRYGVEGDLEPVDIKDYERRQQPEPGPVGEVVRGVGEPQPVAERPVNEPEPQSDGRGQGRDGQDVSGQLGRLQGPLERELSPTERAAYEPLVEQFRNAQTIQDRQSSYRAIFDKLWREKFGPIFGAGKIALNEVMPTDFDAVAAANYDDAGNLSLLWSHAAAADASHYTMLSNNDPVAYLHRIFDEELVHHAEMMTISDRWNREHQAGKTQELFSDYLFRRKFEVVKDLLSARDKALAKGRTAEAQEITDAIRHSMRVYDNFRMSDSDADSKFGDLVHDSGLGSRNARNSLSNVASELIRQMDQLKRGDLTENYWRGAVGRAVDFYRNAIDGLKTLAGRLAPGQWLAKTQLARLVRATERKLATLIRRANAARGEISAPESRGTETGIGPESPGVRDWLAERLRKARTAYGLAFKGGESAMLDYDETRNLARAIRRKPSLVQAYGQRAKLAQLADAFNSVPRAERGRVKQEFSDYTRAEQMKQPLPAIGADTMRLVNATKDTLEGFGQIAKGLNVHVKDSEGRVRPMRLIGRDYYPRMISADMRDIFNNRDSSRAADFDALLQRQIGNGVVKDRQEFIDKFTHAINGEPFSNDHFSNVERAREARLPLEFYDFSPEAALKYAGRASDRLAQIGSFGQKLSQKGKDMFDLAIDKVNKSGNLSYQAKEALINRISSERKAQYTAGPVSGLERAGSLGRNVASGLYLSNWQTAFRNLVTGAAQNMVFGGPSSFIKTAMQFPFEWRKIITEAKDRNLFRANLRNVLDDYDLATNPNWWERGGRKMADIALKYGGHNLTEAINRSFAMQQGKQILRDFTRDYGVNDNALSRARNEFVARRFGFRHDEDASRTLTALARESGVGPLSDEFLRQYVMDVHANYGPGQSPANLLNSPAGKMLFQFQRWGANASRMMTREYIMPWMRAMQSGDFADKGYHTLRMLGFLAAGTGVGGAFQAAINTVYHRDPKDPTLAEIGKMVSQGDYRTAFSYGIQKAYGLMLLSGFSGLFGDYAGMIQEHMGKDPGGRFKDPLHPPAFSIVEPFMALYEGWKGEGGAVPSPKLMDDFLQKLSSTYRVGKQMTLGLATSAGLKMPLAQEYQAQNDRNFTRQRIAMYEAQDPALQQKAEQKGTQATIVSMAGRSPFSPVRDKIINGLLSGNSEEVNGAMRDWLTKVPLEDRKAQYNKIKENINSNSPIKVGGSTKPEAVMDFLEWAKNNLPESEARRIFALASTYAKTALETGLEEKSKGMHQMATLDYDKFKAPVVSAQAQAAAKSKAEAQGQALMQQLARRQRVAGQLLGR